MNEKLENVKKILNKYNQEEILDTLECLDENEKEKILDDILKLDFEQLKKLYNIVLESKQDNKKIINKIEPINYVDKEKLNVQEREKYEKLGENAIKNNKYAVITMAGGQGTRLGHNGPKGTFDFGLSSHKTIFEVLCEKLKDAYKKYNIYIPWYIMTSKENNSDTIKFFEKNNYFNYPKENITFFIQDELPMLNEEGKIIIGEDKRVKQAADGHGGIFASMDKNNIIEDMKKRGIEWIYIGGVDNILANFADPIFIGLAIDKNVLIAGKSLIKACPEEKVGVFCMKNERPSVIEYSEISKEMSEERTENGELKYGESHILCNLFNIKAIEKISKNKLPYHVAYKKCNYINEKGELIIADKPNAYKFEAFIFDAFERMEKIEILRVKREEEFAPIKNAKGEDSPETARKLYENFYNVK